MNNFIKKAMNKSSTNYVYIMSVYSKRPIHSQMRCMLRPFPLGMAYTSDLNITSIYYKNASDNTTLPSLYKRVN